MEFKECSKETKQRSEEQVFDPKVGPKGDYKPTELCKVLGLLRKWREDSSHSQLLVR